ncbi:YfiR family protein [Marivirga sp. S37H4]|uniref:YfiR family protein n=1 Tax=Marivirga aurantiaca TaxID=2802615 RepID=A0A934WYJ8_9BACT|nr:YfiR family protein [Marivirga aurantiaca]MBK6265200.1 YfiR family protein [Marivirga aurantiaca]
MKKISKVLIVVVLMAFGFTLNSADRPIHEIHSMLMFNFIKYVEWPEQSKTGEFVIAVVGDEDVYNTITNFYLKRPIKGQDVKVIGTSDFNSISNAHVIYLSDNSSKEFDAIHQKFAGKPTLIITDKSGLGKKGSCINFQEVNGKLKFEINQESIQRNNLKVSSQLASMGILL